MKIGILTQPLINNYGGLMQAWALQRALNQMGHQAIIIDRHSTRRKDLLWPRRIASTLKSELNIFFRREKRRIILSEEQNDYIRKNIIPFIKNRYLGISTQLYTNKALSQYVNNENFDAFVVGSDQVWRPCYSPSIGNYFLDFLNTESNAKRIAYAASFGVDNWEYTKKQTEFVRPLAQKFDLITVRELSGVKLVENYLKCKATHVLDPTMLHDKNDYLNLVNEPSVPLHKLEGELFCYVLDKKNELENIINRAENETGFKPYYCNASRKVITHNDVEHLDECVFPPIEQWIKSFYDAKMVITDSFHGTVFSIIFNKPFWVVTNKERGETRFTSLLGIFGLENRIVNEKSNTDWMTPIDWEKVNIKRHQCAKVSKQLLINALK